MRVETHIHTKYSHDSILGFWFLYLKLKVANIKCAAITEHNNIIGAIKFKEFCSKHNLKIDVIVGEEIMTDSGEVIGLYLKENIPKGLTPEETISRISMQDGLVYIPHPYDEKRKGTVLSEQAIQKNLKYIDCIECHNGRNFKNEFSLEQEKIAQKYHLPVVIGSDAHTFIEIGRNYMEFNLVPVNANAFRNELKSAVLHKEKCIGFSHNITKCVRLWKLITGGNWGELRRIVIKKLKY